MDLFIVFRELEFTDSGVFEEAEEISVGLVRLSIGTVFIPCGKSPSAFEILFMGEEGEARTYYEKRLTQSDL